jgi:single-stranded-DNA-specific exonuclease
VVTDHHLPGTVLPDADAIVNPNRTDDRFASKNLAGVGVAFYLLMALRARLRDTGWFNRSGLTEPNLAQWLDLVALGTVADVVPLDRNNRILVAQGLARIRAGQACEGIKALLAVAGRDPGRCVAADLGFAVGPRLNAAGRLQDMTIGIACLLSDGPQTAQRLAAELDGLNVERRAIEARMQAEAISLLETLDEPETDTLPPVALCLYDPNWHPGVVGLLAARIKERLHRPVIAFARDSEGTVKGSARSIAGLHIRDVLDAVATRHPHLIDKFGGHAMAAGLSLRESDLNAFRDAFTHEVARQLDPASLEGELYSDGELAQTEFNLELATQLRYGGPWGQGFPEPLFDGRFDLLDWRVVGERHLKMRVRPVGATQALDAIAFNQEPLPGLSQAAQVELAFRLDVNVYQGYTQLQLLVEHMRLPDMS